MHAIDFCLDDNKESINVARALDYTGRQICIKIKAKKPAFPFLHTNTDDQFPETNTKTQKQTTTMIPETKRVETHSVETRLPLLFGPSDVFAIEASLLQ